MLRLSLGAGFSRVGFDAYVASLPIALLAAGWTDGAIGALMGVAALTQLPTSFIGGGLLDRFGGRLLFLAGASSFAVASLLVATGIASPDGPPAVMVLVRVFQGMGIAVLMPAALSLVPTWSRWRACRRRSPWSGWRPMCRWPSPRRSPSSSSTGRPSRSWPASRWSR